MSSQSNAQEYQEIIDQLKEENKKALPSNAQQHRPKFEDQELLKDVNVKERAAKFKGSVAEHAQPKIIETPDSSLTGVNVTEKREIIASALSPQKREGDTVKGTLSASGKTP